ncbi:MAG: hypothetical protein CMF31_09515 [Kordiimonas sp.]|nr:hypothetical protein [Kordiimonas sp.]|tara:strand:- start:1081 stop:1521 length:441 start_codon:yes stop_codon:yes gene_type:complete
MIDELYQREILKMAATASHAGRIKEPTHSTTIHNPNCGDRITIDVVLEDNKIQSYAHETKACVLCQATASLIGEYIEGKTVEELCQVETLLTTALQTNTLTEVKWPAPEWEKLTAFSAVGPHKSRHHCVTLPFEALAALDIKNVHA